MKQTLRKVIRGINECLLIPSLILVTGTNIYTFYQHRNDNIEIRLVSNTDDKNTSYDVEASLGGKRFTCSILSAFKNSGLDKEISMSDQAKTLENAARTAKWFVSASTFGEDQYGKPLKEIGYNVEANYDDWGSGPGFVSSLKFKPK